MLSDGGTAHIRPIRPDDVEQLRALHARLSPQSIYFRFFSPIPRIPEPQLHRLAEVDYRDRFALVAELDAQVVAVVRYDRDTERAHRGGGRLRGRRRSPATRVWRR